MRVTAWKFTSPAFRIRFSPQMCPMTPKDEERIRALTHLIANEKDQEKIKALADELGRLLTLERKPLPIPFDKPRSS